MNFINRLFILVSIFSLVFINILAAKDSLKEPCPEGSTILEQNTLPINIDSKCKLSSKFYFDSFIKNNPTLKMINPKLHHKNVTIPKKSNIN